MVKTHRNSGQYVAVAIWFIGIVVCIIGISFLWKIAVVVAHGSFDGKQQFVMEISKQGSMPKVLIFTPGTHTLQLLILHGIQESDGLSQTLEIPIDTVVTNNDVTSKAQIPSFIEHLLFDGSIPHTTIIDRFRLWLYALGVSADNLSETTLSLPANQQTIDKTLTSVMNDTMLYQEGKTIAIVNATGEGGYGTRITKLLTNIGATVISVTSTDMIQNKTQIQYIGMPNYTTARIEKILGLQAKASAKTADVSDVIITIGTDKIGTKEF